MRARGTREHTNGSIFKTFASLADILKVDGEVVDKERVRCWKFKAKS